MRMVLGIDSTLLGCPTAIGNAVPVSLLAILVFIAGGGIAMQALVNARLSLIVGGPLVVNAINFVIGASAACLVLLLSRAPVPSLAQLGQSSWWMYTGGLFGVLLVGISMVAVAKLGAGLLTALIVAGQLIIAVLADHYGWFGLKQQPVDLWRVLGILMLLGGAWLIQRPSG